MTNDVDNVDDFGGGGYDGKEYVIYYNIMNSLIVIDRITLF